MKIERIEIPDERGRAPKRAWATAPASLTDGAPADHEGRLSPELRALAGRPLEALGEATFCLWRTKRTLDRDLRGRACAELAVTGERSWHAFGALDRQGLPERIVSAGHLAHPEMRDDARARQIAEQVIRYAEDVSAALRARTHAERRAARQKVPSLAKPTPRYVAVSGEDDLPDRPVNLPSSTHVVDDLWVPVRARGRPVATYPKLRVRYARTESFQDRDAPLVVLLHGLGSRLEEHDEVMRHLEHRGLAAVAMDLPNQGYSQRISFENARVASDMQRAGSNVGGPFRAIELYEHFVRSFVETLDRSIPAARVKKRLRLIAGGSQGGTLSLRLGSSATPSWLPRVAAWSPGSVWESFWNDDGWHWLAVGDGGPLSQIRRGEDAGARRDYIRGIFEPRFPTQLFFGRIADTWWRSSANYRARKEAHIRGARAARHEVYDEWHRRWCSAMEQEQLAHSFRGRDDDANWKFTRIGVPLMLVAGTLDAFEFANIHRACRDLVSRAAEKEQPDGTFCELTNTGHSAHDERPEQLAALLARHALG